MVLKQIIYPKRDEHYNNELLSITNAEVTLEPQAGNVLEDTKLIYILNQKA
jgi:hypothetical protein